MGQVININRAIEHEVTDLADTSGYHFQRVDGRYHIYSPAGSKVFSVDNVHDAERAVEHFTLICQHAQEYGDYIAEMCAQQ